MATVCVYMCMYVCTVCICVLMHVRACCVCVDIVLFQIHDYTQVIVHYSSID